MPGTYTLEATHPQFQLVQPKLPIVIAQENLVIPDQSLVVNGYSLSGNVKSSGEPISGVSFLLFSKNAKPTVRGKKVLCNSNLRNQHEKILGCQGM